MTLADYDAMLLSQDGKCAICGTETSAGKGRFSVDHDHGTGKIRGLLCNNCNAGIGLLKDDPRVLRYAANYLESHGAVSNA